MPGYIRKSFRFGPLRINVSKSGVGYSLGVKGARIGIRPDGRRYLHAGRDGLYARQELGGPSANGAPSGLGLREMRDAEIEAAQQRSAWVAQSVSAHQTELALLLLLVLGITGAFTCCGEPLT